MGWTSDSQEAAAAHGKSVPWQGREDSTGHPYPPGIFLGVSHSLPALLRAQQQPTRLHVHTHMHLASSLHLLSPPPGPHAPGSEHLPLAGLATSTMFCSRVLLISSQASQRKGPRPTSQLASQPSDAATSASAHRAFPSLEAAAMDTVINNYYFDYETVLPLKLLPFCAGNLALCNIFKPYCK